MIYVGILKFENYLEGVKTKFNTFKKYGFYHDKWRIGKGVQSLNFFPKDWYLIEIETNFFIFQNIRKNTCKSYDKTSNTIN